MRGPHFVAKSIPKYWSVLKSFGFSGNAKTPQHNSWCSTRHYEDAAAFVLFLFFLILCFYIYKLVIGLEMIIIIVVLVIKH